MANPSDGPRPLVGGKYQLSRVLGRGGMGTVWEGIHVTLGARVAIKFIDAEHASSPEARSRFDNEAFAAASLRSKHVVEVYDHGLTEDGRPFIVMEYLEGEPLDRRLERQRRLPAKETARMLQQVCRALAKAHASGIVHRDLKPENIFLVWDDEDGADVAKVVDFGIAKFTDSLRGGSSGTRTGSVLGTPYYMSPEQARGLRSLDYRTDLWSLGVIAYRCIVGCLPFEGEGIGDLLVKICTDPLPVPSRAASGLPGGFDHFIERALARDPAQRYQSAAEFSAALGVICGITLPSAYVTGETTPFRAPGGDPVSSGQAPEPSAASQGTTLRSSPVELRAGTEAPLTRTRRRTLVRTPLLTGLLLSAALVLGFAIPLLVGVRVHSPPARVAEQPSATVHVATSSAGPVASLVSTRPTIQVIPVDPRPSVPAASVSAVIPAPNLRGLAGNGRPLPLRSVAEPVRAPLVPIPSATSKPTESEIDLGY